MKNELKFKEIQAFGPTWMVILISMVSLLIHVIAFLQLIQGIPVGNVPAPDWVLVLIWLLIGLGLPLLLIFARLETQVSEKGISYRLFPFQWKYRNLERSQIESASFHEYRPMRDYGGWGIRIGLKGSAITTKGTEGVLFKLGPKRTLLIGSQKARLFADAVDAYLKQ